METIKDDSKISPPLQIKYSKKEKKKKKSRCAHIDCRKRLDITAWACKCEKKFCQGHRPANIHSCSYNWQLDYKKSLNDTMLQGKSIDTKNFVSI